MTTEQQQEHPKRGGRHGGAPGGDPEMERIVAEEERALARVLRTLAARTATPRGPGIDYDAELIALRDQINEARVEDIPPLIEEMERLQQVAARRAKVTQGHVDAKSPYFGRLVLEEPGRKREVLIGRGTFLDSTTGIRIVDWRDAPVSRIYYRYDEGDDYDETFGGRDVNGEVLVRRNLVITDGQLRRIGTPQGTFIRDSHGHWRRAAASATRLSGGQGTALRPEAYHKPGQLGVGAEGSDDKRLSEITALIDSRQFDLISRPGSGLVVIQGGAGSGKTTIGLHRLAWLAYQEPRRFRADQMLVVVFNDALARYVARVLPALGAPDVPVTTYESWAHKLRVKHVHGLPPEPTEDTPSVVMRLKKHPAMLRLIDARAEALAKKVEEAVVGTGKKLDGGGKALRVWRETAGMAPGRRAERLLGWLSDPEGEGQKLPLATRHALERVLGQVRREARDVVSVWSEMLTDRALLGATFAEHAPDAFTDEELDEAHGWCTRRCAQVVAYREELLHRASPDDRGDNGGRESIRKGVDGADLDEEMEHAALDREDDTLLLRLIQRMRGPLRRKKSALRYEHIFVDEAQDMSPVELSVVLDTATRQRSVTLAGDIAQRLHMDNGFSDWRTVLHELGLDHVEIEPLKLSYRSTHEIMDFARSVLGPLRKESSGFEAPRHGAPVELFRFAHSGDAAGFLAEALRELVQSEPRASVALITRYPEQADMYYAGLRQGEVPNLRRIAEQDFPFRAGVDVTDVRQVKGLEFDYVVLAEVSSASFPEDTEARHLLHIAATRAAHQLWVTTTGEPSHLLPDDLRKREY